MTAALLGLVLSITTAFTPDLAIPEDVTHSPVVDPFLQVTQEIESEWNLPWW